MKLKIKLYQKITRHIYDDFNLKKQAYNLGVEVWQTPSFLFICMGLAIMVAMAVVYFVSFHYDSPFVLIISEVLVVIIMLIVGGFIIKSVEIFAQANKTKSEFISLASHQLKTPLAGLKWSLEFLLSKRRNGLNKEQISILKDIEELSLKMEQLVSDLLDAARIDSGELFLNKDKADLEGIIEEIEKNNLSLLKAKKISFSFKRKNKVPLVMADKKRIKVVLDNLISNAIQYTSNEGMINVEAEKKDDKIKICVKDNGIGIPSDQQKRVFEKFFRGTNTEKLFSRGTGLGLYITKNIVEKSGGEIQFKSIEGVGSEFCFWLPIEEKKKR